MTEQEPDLDAMTEAEYATWLNENREKLTFEELERPMTVSPDVSAVVSVRIPNAELAIIEAAAHEAGMPLSTYIRQAAVATAHTINLDKARRDLARVRTAVTDLERHLGVA